MKVASSVEAAGVAIDQLVYPRQDDSAGSLGFNLQKVAGLEPCLVKRGGGYRHLVLAGHLGLILYLLSYK
jgi:hypothetical protein